MGLKYKNIKTVINGIKLDSKKEAGYYGILRLKEKARLIERFEMQVRYDLVVNGLMICFYKADFVTYKHGKVSGGY
jgi:hypothetical protein